MVNRIKIYFLLFSLLFLCDLYLETFCGIVIAVNCESLPYDVISKSPRNCHITFIRKLSWEVYILSTLWQAAKWGHITLLWKLHWEVYAPKYFVTSFQVCSNTPVSCICAYIISIIFLAKRKTCMKCNFFQVSNEFIFAPLLYNPILHYFLTLFLVFLWFFFQDISLVLNR